MRYLGVDFGLAHTGIALGDDESRLATAFLTVHEKDRVALIKQIQALVVKEEIDQLVIGKPLAMSGASHQQAGITEAFVKQLQAELTIPVVLSDERLSSQFAQRQKQEDPLGKHDVHALAAASILQIYLDSL